jgi:hypothetical protein
MKHKKKIMGHTIFVPIDASIEVNVSCNFYTNKCGWCGSMFRSFKKSARYCSPSHKASAGRKRMLQNYESEIASLKEKIKLYEAKHNK